MDVKYCKRCGVEVVGEREVCPLCSSVLHVDEKPARQEDSFPDIAAKRKVRRKVFWICAYICVLIEALKYGFPCVLLGFAAIILLCMIINFANWQNYLTMQVLMAAFSLVFLIYSFMGKNGNLILAWVVFGIYLTLWVMTMIIGGRKAENEIRRKFHL